MKHFTYIVYNLEKSSKMIVFKVCNLDYCLRGYWCWRMQCLKVGEAISESHLVGERLPTIINCLVSRSLNTDFL